MPDHYRTNDVWSVEVSHRPDRAPLPRLDGQAGPEARRHACGAHPASELPMDDQKGPTAVSGRSDLGLYQLMSGGSACDITMVAGAAGGRI
jgi:hypothetical protein